MMHCRNQTYQQADTIISQLFSLPVLSQLIKVSQLLFYLDHSKLMQNEIWLVIERRVRKPAYCFLSILGVSLLTSSRQAH